MHLTRLLWTRAWRDKHKREFSHIPPHDLRIQHSRNQPSGRLRSVVWRPPYEHAELTFRSNSSGELNAKQRELLELQALAQRRLKGVRANFAQGLKTARETKRDLEWTQRRVR